MEEEHKVVRRSLDEIQTAADHWSEIEDFTLWKIEIIWQMRDFKNTLVKHFDYEEESGFIEEMKTEAPEAIRPAEQLKSEHQEIMDEINTIIRNLKEMDKKEDNRLKAIQKLIHNLVKKIHEHEAEENKLIQQVYCQEYGYPSS